jgi:mono/diheme cytochrome c family protein
VTEGPPVEVIEPTIEPAETAPVAPRKEERLESREAAEAAGAIPRWLAALFVIVPAVVVLYALFLPNGPNCGDGGVLAVDPITGEASGCDGTPYGVEVVDYFSLGLEQYASCVSCHGENGGGAGNFPAFVGGELLSTFPEGQCEDQVRWVTLGTADWPDATYGATAKPVGGSGAVMPAFEGSLTDEEIRSVVLFERVRFGGQDLAAALEDCGLEDEEGDGETETAAG